MTGANLHLTAGINGSQASLTVTDGTSSAVVHHTISSPKLQGEGGVGLAEEIDDYAHDSYQRFGNFHVSDADGKTIAADRFDGPNGSIPPGWNYIHGAENPIKPGWGAKIDGIGWHWGGGSDPGYMQQVKDFKKECEALGFRGKYFATELYVICGYPPGPPATVSEEQMAKLFTQSGVMHAAMDMEGGPCHPHFTGYPLPQTLTRWTWPTQIINPCQPSMTYYMWRSVATATDDLHPAEFPVELTADKQCFALTFRRGDGELVVASWIMGGPSDGIVETKADIALPGTVAKHAWVIDIMNGTEQELNIGSHNGSTVIKGMLIKDYPVLMRLATQ
jgi:hypothetical protein